MAESLQSRLTRYLSYDTEAIPDSSSVPSNRGQVTLGKLLASEMVSLGCVQVGEYANNGAYFVMGKIPTNIDFSKHTWVPPIGFIAHLDTSYNYPYSNEISIVHTIEQLYSERGINLRSKAWSESEYEQWLTDGIIVPKNLYTSIGIKNKAGIAEIMGMIEYLHDHPEVAHGKICICFTSDAELGRAMDHIKEQGTAIQSTSPSGEKLYYNRETNVITTNNTSGLVVPVMELYGGFDARMAFLVEAEGQNTVQYNNYSIVDFEIRFKGLKVSGQSEEDAQINAIKNACIFVSELADYETGYSFGTGDTLAFIRSLNGDYTEAILQIQIKSLTTGIQSSSGSYENASLQDKIDKIKTLLYSSEGYVENYVTMTQVVKQTNARSKIPQSQIDLAINANYQHYARATSSTPIKNGYSAAALSNMGIPSIIIGCGGYNFYTYRECIPIRAMSEIQSVLLNIVTKAVETVDTSTEFANDFPFQVSIPNEERIFTKSLIHFDSTFNTTSPPTDEAGEYNIMTPTGIFSTTQKKFGAGALQGVNDPSQDSTTALTIKNVVLGGQTFTIDFWFYANGIRDLSIIEHQEKIIQLYNNEVWFNNQRILTYWVNNNLNKWNHVAYVYNHEAGIMNFYVNGKNLAAVDSRLMTPTTSDLKLLIKGREDSYDQYIDEFRVSIGVARWKNDFTPPTSSYTLTA